MAQKKVNRYFIHKEGLQEERINQAFGLLGLEGMKGSFQRISEKALKEKKPPYDILESLLVAEVALKEENRIERWLQQARFPWQKTIENFDFSFQPKMDKTFIHELAACRFIEKGKNVIFLGQSGVGKTHLSIALGIEAIHKGYEVRFLRLDELIDLVEKTVDDGDRSFRLFRSLVRPRLLILDDIDFYETDERTATFLFKLVIERYEERKSMIFTSNKSWKEWGGLFGNRTRASAAIDRITDRRHIVEIKGDSYRLKGKNE